MEVTRDLHNSNFRVLLCQTLFNLAIAAVVEAIFVWISVKQVPPLHKVAALYLKLVMSSDF